MLSLLTPRALLQNSKRFFTTSVIRLTEKKEVQKVETDKDYNPNPYEGWPDPLEYYSGYYKRELMLYLSGHTDIYNNSAIKRGEGSKEKPNLIPSCFESRLMGCICEEDSHTIVWMWLHRGEKKRCYCGHYFKLVYAPAMYDTDIDEP